MTRRIAFLIYPGFQLLDAAGPMAAFEVVNRYHPDAYQARIIAAIPGDIPSSSGATLNALLQCRIHGRERVGRSSLSHVMPRWAA